MRDDCPNCGQWLGRRTGHSSIYHNGGVTLCEECWFEEEDLIGAEGTNDPELSPIIAERLARYRRAA